MSVRSDPPGNKAPGLKRTYLCLVVYLIFHTLFFPPISIYAQTQGFEKKENSYTDDRLKIIEVVRLLKKETFIINMKNGVKYKSKIEKVGEYGIVLAKKSKGKKSVFIEWEHISNIQLAKTSKKAPIGYLVKHFMGFGLAVLFIYGLIKVKSY